MAIMEDKTIYYYWGGGGWGMYTATIKEKNILPLVKGSNVTMGVMDAQGMSLTGQWEYLIIWGRWGIRHLGKLEWGGGARRGDKERKKRRRKGRESKLFWYWIGVRKKKKKNHNWKEVMLHWSALQQQKIYMHILLLFKIIANQVKRRVPPRRALNAAIFNFECARNPVGIASLVTFVKITSHCQQRFPAAAVEVRTRLCDDGWKYLHKVCQCIFVSMCSSPAELLNYHLLLSLCVCARVCVGIKAFIFVDVIMFICMPFLLLFFFPPIFSAAVRWIIVSLPDPQSLNVGLETFMYVCMYRTCLYTSFLISSYLFELQNLGCIHNHYFTLGTQADGQYGWSVASKSQLHWQVTVNWINYHHAYRKQPNVLLTAWICV